MKKQIIIIILFTFNCLCQSNLNYIRNSFEIKLGYEVNRKIPEAIFGYKNQFSNFFSFVPELSYICGIIPSASMRFHYKMHNNLTHFLQLGVGIYSGLIWFTGPNSLISTGFEYQINREIKIQSELRVVFFGDNAETRSLSIENFNIVDYKPVVISVGIAF